MKTTGFRSFVLYILIAAFLGGLGYFLLELCMNGAQWVTQPYNGHIYGSDAAIDAGNVTDRDGVVLARSADGSRIYAENENTRRAMLHTVGDSSGYISTSVQAIHRPKLMGWNIFTGLNHTLLTGLVNDVRLTVDAEASAAAYKAMNGHDGAVFIYNYKTGETLVKVSAPSYDPNNVPGDLHQNEKYNGVFLDNTLSSTFTPGSVFKIITAAAAVENLPDWQTRTYTCERTYAIGNSSVVCMEHHGNINLEQAFGHSCNVYFARLALDLGPDTLQRQAEKMGFNMSFSFDTAVTAKSTVDLSAADDLMLGWSSVGQGEVLVNPYQMALLAGAIANGGSTPEPYLTGSATGTEYELVDSSTAAALHAMMRTAVSKYYGDSLFAGYTVCAKTGTAEIDGKNPNCWIVGFCTDKDKPYAFAVMVEEGSGGLSTAGSVLTAALKKLS